MITFSNFAPDLDHFTETIIVDCSNIIPSEKGYKAAPSEVDAGLSALAAACIGAVRAVKLDGSARVFAGTTTHLYEDVSGTWTDRSGATYTGTSSDKWRFAQYGDVTLAVNNADTIQWSSTGAFASITACPVAKHIITLKNFVIVANTNDGTSGETFGDQSDRWWCSALNDYTDWTPAVSTQCTSGRLIDVPGEITALKPLGDYAVIYKESGMYLGRYVGPPVVWSWINVSSEIGTVSSESVIDIGTAHFFLGKDDFYMFDGSRPMPIGNAVKNWFFSDMNATYRDRIQGAHDRNNSLVYWFYPSTDSTSGEINKAIIYNYKTNQWGLGTYDVEMVLETLLGGVTYGTLGDLYTTYADLTGITYGSSVFSADARAIAVFDSTHTLYSLTGSGKNSTIKTAIYGDDELVSLLQRIRPRFVVPPTTGQMINLYCMCSSENMTQDATTTLSNGKFDVLRAARWHQAQFNFTGDVTITGFTAMSESAGSE